MTRVKKIQHKGKEILQVDYSNCRGDEMIAVFEQARAIVLAEQGQFLILSVFNERSFLSSAFMKHVEREIPLVDMYLSKQAVTGLSSIQQWILKGLNMWYKRQVHSFDHVDQAMDFLVSD